MADTLRIGSVAFEIDDMPEGIGMGGDAMISVLQFPGGYREVQHFGTQDRDIAFQGQLNYSSVNKMRSLDKMYKSGNVYTIVAGPFTFTAIISKFYWDYVSSANIQYDLTLTPTSSHSLVTPKASSASSSSSGISVSGSTSGGTTSAPPKNVSPKPERTYRVKHGDSLWAIAHHFYHDGSQWRKIYTANKLHSTIIYSGQKLVIP